MDKISREGMMAALNITSYEGTDKDLALMYKLMTEHKPKEEPKKVYIKVDKTTTKYKLLLEYVNGILRNMGKEPVDDLSKFQNIDRLDIIKEENRQLLNKMAPRLFKQFSKDKCGFYRSKKSINFPLNVLKGMVKELGLIITRSHYTKSIGGKNKSFCVYKIIDYKTE